MNIEIHSVFALYYVCVCVCVCVCICIINIHARVLLILIFAKYFTAAGSIQMY